MKHHYELITLNGFQFLLDLIEPIKVNDYYIDDTNTIRICVTNDKRYWNERKDYNLILASTDLSLNLPSIIDKRGVDVEELAKYYKYPNEPNEADFDDKEKFEQEFGAWEYMNNECKESFKDGYTQCLKTNQFSLEQVYSIMSHIYTHTREDEKGVRRFVTGKVATNTDIVEDWKKSNSLSQKDGYVELEEERMYDNPKLNGNLTFKGIKPLLTTINNQSFLTITKNFEGCDQNK